VGRYTTSYGLGLFKFKHARKLERELEEIAQRPVDEQPSPPHGNEQPPLDPPRVAEGLGVPVPTLAQPSPGTHLLVGDVVRGVIVGTRKRDVPQPSEQPDVPFWAGTEAPVAPRRETYKLHVQVVSPFSDSEHYVVTEVPVPLFLHDEEMTEAVWATWRKLQQRLE
jgi:hypothetical protein